MVLKEHVIELSYVSVLRLILSVLGQFKLVVIEKVRSILIGGLDEVYVLVDGVTHFILKNKL